MGPSNSGGSNGRSGLRIRPPGRMLGQQNKVAEYDRIWTMLRSSLLDIHQKRSGTLLFEELYRACYKIVITRQECRLWDDVIEFELKWFKEMVTPTIAPLLTPQTIDMAIRDTAAINNMSPNLRCEIGEMFLKGIKAKWQEHVSSMTMISDIVMYMDRATKAGGAKPAVFTVTIGMFRDHVLLAPIPKQYNPNYVVQDIVNGVVSDIINCEREGMIIDQSLIRAICVMLEDLHETDDEMEVARLYKTRFMPHFLDQSREFYALECRSLLDRGNATDWVRVANKRLEEELTRSQTTLLDRSLDEVLDIVRDELIIKYVGEFLALPETGLAAMIDCDRRDELKALYRLLLLVDHNVPHLREALRKHVERNGIELEKNLMSTDFSNAAAVPRGNASEEPAAGTLKPLNAAAQATQAAIKWVGDVLAMRKRFHNMLTTCFDGNPILETVISDSFSSFINLFPRPSEFISLYIDDIMKNWSKKDAGSDIEAALKEVMPLISHIKSKDLFEQYYQKHLARRLLLDRTESWDLEKWFVGMMKQLVGTHFTSKFEGMFKDLTLSAELRSSFKDRSEGARKIDLAINILTPNFWPSESMGMGKLQASEARLVAYPEDIKKLQKELSDFYTLGKTGRVLTWVPSAGTAEMKCVFPKTKDTGPTNKERRYELVVTTYGMIVLSLFNGIGDKWLSFEEIKGRTNIPEKELERTLAAICIPPKSRVLLKEPMSKTIKATDKFAFNSSFVSKTMKIKAPTVPVSRVESTEERQRSQEVNKATREFACNAALVRVMKQRKELTHTLLVDEVMNQLSSRFCPAIPVIKEQIEELITKDYLERTTINGLPGYRYLA